MPVKKDPGIHPATDYAGRIRALLESDRIVQARELVSEALQSNPGDPEILNLYEVLKPPRGKPRQIIDSDRSQEFEWMIRNREAYRGRWVAVEGDRLVADAASFAELQSRIQDLDGVPLVHRID